MKGLEWLQSGDNLKRLCDAFIANDGVVPKNNEHGNALLAIMKEVREAIGNDEPSDGCVDLINNQLALSGTSLPELMRN